MKIDHFSLYVLQVNAEHSDATTSVLNEDVLEDLFESNMKNNARLCKQSDVCCFQSTQVTRSDIPGGTIIIEPDFPLSPLQHAAPVVLADTDRGTVFTSPIIHSAGGQCSVAEMLTVTAVLARPVTTIINCTEAHLVSSQSSDVTFPSAVYDRVRNLFCTTNSEINPNRLSETLSCSTASDTGQQNRPDDELVTEVSKIVCTTAVSCNGDSSPLESSYVDAGHMAYTESNVNVLAKVSVENAADIPAITTGIDSNVSELRITNVCSLRDNVAIESSLKVPQSLQSPCQETCMKSSFSSSSTKRALQGGQNSFIKKSPTDNASSKQKLSLDREPPNKSDVLFAGIKQMKRPSKKRRLYKGDMLTEDRMEEQPQHSDNVDTHMHREKNDVKGVRSYNPSNCETVVSRHEILPISRVPAAVPANCGETNEYPAIDCINNVITSRQNSVEVTGVESDATQVCLSTGIDVNTKYDASLIHFMPVAVVNKLSHISLEKQMLDVKRGEAVSAETNRLIETGTDTAVVVSTSAVSSPPVPTDRLNTVSRAITNVSMLNPAVCDSAVTKHAVDTETSSEILSAVASQSYHSSLIRQDDSILVQSSPMYSSNDTAPGNSQRHAPETSNVPVITSLPTDVARHSSPQSLSVKGFYSRSLSCCADVKSVSFDNTSDLALGNNVVTGNMKDRNIDWYSQNKKRNLSRKKFQRQTTRARTNSITDHNKNVVTAIDDISDNHRPTSETPCRENTSSAVGLCIQSQNTNESSSPSLLCGQKRSSGSYSLPNITPSVCRLSAVGTPFLPSNSCSLQYQERCRIAEESLGYHPPSTKADDIVLSLVGHKDKLVQSERCSPTDLIPGLQSNMPNTCSEEQATGVIPAVSGMTNIHTSAGTASVSGTEIESKQSLSVTSNCSRKLTLPTPKNSLTCHQPVKCSPSVAPVTESLLVSAVSQVQPNYGVIQVFDILYVLKLFYC